MIVEPYYACMISFGDTKAMVMAENPLTKQVVPMLYAEKYFKANEQNILREVQEIATKHGQTIELIKFSEPEIIDAIFPEHTALN